MIVGVLAAVGYMCVPSPARALTECQYEADKLLINAPPARPASANPDKEGAQVEANSRRYSRLMADCMKSRRFGFDQERAGKNMAVPDDTLYFDASYWHLDWRP